MECHIYQLSTCVIAEYRFEHSDEVDVDETDRPVGLPSGVYGRGVHSKHYMSFSSFDNVENVSVCIIFLLKYLSYCVTLYSVMPQ